MLVNPFLKTTNTRLAPQRRAEVAQSNAVSPAPSTMTLPWRLGREGALQEHIPEETKTLALASSILRGVCDQVSNKFLHSILLLLLLLLTWLACPTHSWQELFRSVETIADGEALKEWDHIGIGQTCSSSVYTSTQTTVTPTHLSQGRWLHSHPPVAA